MEINKFILIAANSGVGKAFLSVALNGATAHRLMATTRTPPPEDKTASDRTVCPAPFNPLDLTSLLRFRKAVEEFTQGDRYAVVMPVSYFAEHKPGIAHTLEENRNILEANYVAPQNIMQTLIPHMMRNGGGHFIAFSCQSTRRHDPFMGAFTAAKSALESLIRTNANEYGGTGILFNALRVASIRTEFTVRSKPNGDTGNYVTPDEVAAIAMETIKSPHSGRMNGTITDVFSYSRSFFTNGSLTRIENENNAADIAAWRNGAMAAGGYPKL